MSDEESQTGADIDLILPIYLGYIETISLNELKRQQASQVYLALISALIAAGVTLNGPATSVAACMVIVVSLIWFATIRYHRALAQAKFGVVKDLESRFPYKPFEREWQLFKGDGDSPRTRSIGLTQIELLAPSFLGLAALFTIVALNWELVSAILNTQKS